MKSITSKIPNLVFNIKKGIKDQYKYDFTLLKEIYDDECINDELEDYCYLTYKDYDKLRIIMLNILQLILHDIENKKRKYKKKIINLIYIFNNTYIYFSYPKNIYLYKFQRFVNNILFSYYKDYIYKAKLEYPSVQELPEYVVISFGHKFYQEDYDPLQLKILYRLCKKFRR